MVGNLFRFSSVFQWKVLAHGELAHFFVEISPKAGVKHYQALCFEAIIGGAQSLGEEVEQFVFWLRAKSKAGDLAHIFGMEKIVGFVNFRFAQQSLCLIFE